MTACVARQKTSTDDRLPSRHMTPLARIRRRTTSLSVLPSKQHHHHGAKNGRGQNGDRDVVLTRMHQFDNVPSAVEFTQEIPDCLVVLGLLVCVLARSQYSPS